MRGFPPFFGTSACLSALLIAATPASAERAPQPRASILTSLVACKAIPDIAQRVACYDAQVTALDEAERNKDVVLVDKTQIRETRRNLFGLNLPSIKIFDGGADEAEFRQIETTITSARQGGQGEWIVALADGARWRQIDSNTIMPPKGGQPIRIREGALGSFIANINGQNGIKMRREN